jgi:hypothetical protein
MNMSTRASLFEIIEQNLQIKWHLRWNSINDNSHRSPMAFTKTGHDELTSERVGTRH